VASGGFSQLLALAIALTGRAPDETDLRALKKQMNGTY
jgi:hypothetical protein